MRGSSTFEPTATGWQRRRECLRTPVGWDSQRFFGRELRTVRRTQTVATTASTMSTTKPLVPEIALIIVTSLKATYSSLLHGVPDHRLGVAVRQQENFGYVGVHLVAGEASQLRTWRRVVGP